MNVLRVDHVGVAIRDFEGARGVFEDILGLELSREEVVEDQGVKTSFYPVQDFKFELLESIDPDGPIAKHLEKGRGALQHIAVEVDDLDAALQELKAKGVPLVDETPREGVEHTRIAFVHPKATVGMLLELVEFPADRRGTGGPSRVEL